MRLESREIDAGRLSNTNACPASAESRTVKTMSASSSSIVAAFRATLELYETGIDLMRQNLRRRHPDVDEHDIERLLGEWLRERPGAEFGDCVGRPVDARTRLA